MINSKQFAATGECGAMAEVRLGYGLEFVFFAFIYVCST